MDREIFNASRAALTAGPPSERLPTSPLGTAEAASRLVNAATEAQPGEATIVAPSNGNMRMQPFLDNKDRGGYSLSDNRLAGGIFSIATNFWGNYCRETSK